tara:strand:- start:2664 stop:2903 length:240 start_codon:yes stop_codon:yes gene_type:complete
MFPLIAIAAFFILGIAFFAIGKDDFGIKRVKEVSNDTYVKGNDVINPESAPKNGSTDEKKEEVSAETSSEVDSGDDSSD